jgi:hypothetical protein
MILSDMLEGVAGRKIKWRKGDRGTGAKSEVE